MTFNPSYEELLGREIRKDRMREASRERLIRSMTMANPSSMQKTWYILRDRWGGFWNRILKSRKAYPMSHLPENSTSI